MGEDLVKIGVIDEFDVNNFVNMSFIRKYHKNNK
jgi:hypothetical protein